jgi:amino acid permease
MYILLIAHFWIAFAPIRYAGMTAYELTKHWTELYLAFPISLVFFIGYKFKTRFVKTNMIGFTSG